MLAIVRIERGYGYRNAPLLHREEQRGTNSYTHSLGETFADRDLALRSRAPPCARVNLHACRHRVRPGETDGLQQMPWNLLLLQLIAGLAVHLVQASRDYRQPLQSAMHSRLFRNQ